LQHPGVSAAIRSLHVFEIRFDASSEGVEADEHGCPLVLGDALAFSVCDLR
jgi:hypothetical protein